MAARKKSTKKRKPRANPVLTIRRFKSNDAANDHADRVAESMGIKDVQETTPRRARSVTVIEHVKRPAVLIVTPTRKVPRITPKTPRLS